MQNIPPIIHLVENLAACPHGFMYCSAMHCGPELKQLSERFLDPVLPSAVAGQIWQSVVTGRAV
jgi:hypothetical protein